MERSRSPNLSLVFNPTGETKKKGFGGAALRQSQLLPSSDCGHINASHLRHFGPAPTKLLSQRLGIDIMHHVAMCALRTKQRQVETHIWRVQHALMSEIKPDYAERLEQARARRGFRSARAATQFFGWKYDTYIQHERGLRGISRAASRYAKAFRVSEAWLLTGEGETSSERIVPLLAWVSAGAMLQEEIADEALGTIEVSGLPDGDWIALQVKGDSMDRISPPDSVILVNRQNRRLVANACYVIDDGHGNATYKRFRPNPMRFEPVSTNTEHEPLFPDNEPTIIGRVEMSVLRM